jgi:acetyltransferase
MFDPKTVAVFGDMAGGGTDEKTLLANLLSSGKQRVFWVEPEVGSAQRQGREKKKTASPEGLDALTPYPDIASIGEKIDLVVVASPAPAVPKIVEACGRAGVGGIVIVSESFTKATEDGLRLEEEIRKIGKKYGVRILGPNRASIVRPSKGLNASVFGSQPDRGNIAFITQSTSLGSAVLDWGTTTHIGFSMIVSLGSMVDVDFGDLIDFLGEDPQTRSIMIYMESVGNARKFMSAARGFARNKPIIVVKPGQRAQSADAFLSHTGGASAYDSAYEVAFRRAGVVRVREMSELYNVAEVLHSHNLPKGPRLGIVTNVGSLGIMATDILADFGGRLAELSRESIQALDEILPPYWSKDNPVDLFHEATVDTFDKAIRTCLADAQMDGLLVIYAQSDAAPPTELAEAIAAASRGGYKPLIVAWLGTGKIEEGREILKKDSIPTYETPEEATKTYCYMYRYKRNLELLYETPAELPVNQSPPKNNRKAFVKRTLREGRRILTEAESKNFLSNYGISITTPFQVTGPDVASDVAARIGYPVVLKIVSPDIIHRSDVGAMAIVNERSELASEYEKLLARVAQRAPKVAVQGITVEKIVQGVDYQLVLGAKKDAEFGSVILFGMGGFGVDLFNDISFAIPPLNQTLARLLMEETRIYGILGGSASRRPADLVEIEKIIVSFSNLIVDFPEIAEFYINPLVIANGKACAVNARAVLEPPLGPGRAPRPHVVVTPYPTRYVTPWLMTDGNEVLLRPIKPEDEALEHELLASLSEETMRARFFSVIRDISHEMLVRYCNIDYDREMAIVAELKENDRKRMIGIARLICDREFRSGEFAVLVHDAFQAKGIGYKLVDVIIGIAAEKGLESIFGEVLSDNRRMLAVCAKLGFTIEEADEETTRVSLALR